MEVELTVPADRPAGGRWGRAVPAGAGGLASATQHTAAPFRLGATKGAELGGKQGLCFEGASCEVATTHPGEDVQSSAKYTHPEANRKSGRNAYVCASWADRPVTGSHGIPRERHKERGGEPQGVPTSTGLPVPEGPAQGSRREGPGRWEQNKGWGVAW